MICPKCASELRHLKGLYSICDICGQTYLSLEKEKEKVVIDKEFLKNLHAFVNSYIEIMAPLPPTFDNMILATRLRDRLIQEIANIENIANKEPETESLKTVVKRRKAYSFNEYAKRFSPELDMSHGFILEGTRFIDGKLLYDVNAIYPGDTLESVKVWSTIVGTNVNKLFDFSRDEDAVFVEPRGNGVIHD